MKKNPLVSIIIPVYNGSNFLKDALKSALAQTYKNIEILVVNDGSRDRGATEKIAKSFGKKIRYFRKENGGTGSALNLGIKNMKGDYFAWLSHDDAFLPNKIQVQIDTLKKLPEKVVLYSDFEFVNAKNNFLGTIKIKAPRYDQFVYELIKRRFLHGCTILIPKTGFNEVGLFNEKLLNVQDYEMWFRLFKKGYLFHHIPQVLVKGRIHPDQGSYLRPKIQIIDEEYVYAWALKNFSPKELFGNLKDKSYCYLDLSLRLKKANVPMAAALARKLALKNLSYDNFLPNLSFYFYCLFWSQGINTQYWKNIIYKFLKPIIKWTK